MNKEFIKVNDTNYIVTHDDGNLSLTTNNNNIKKILSKENEIEKINKTILTNNDQLEHIKYIDKFRKILNFGFIIYALILSVLSSDIGIIKSLIIYLVSISIVRLPLISIFGTKSLNKKKRKKLIASIKEDSKKIQTLTKEIEKLKIKSNYQVIHYLKTHISPMEQPINEHNKYKIKRLVSDKK